MRVEKRALGLSILSFEVRSSQNDCQGLPGCLRRAGLDKKLIPIFSKAPYGTYTMEKSGNAFAVSKSIGHADLKLMEPYQHQELEPLRVAINQRNRRKKFAKVLENAS